MSDQNPPPNAAGTAEQRNVALAERRNVQTWADPDWQRFWLTVDKLPWKTLALIPAGEGGPADFTLTLAVTLSRTGVTHLGGPVLVADGTQVPLNQLQGFLADVRSCTQGGERVLVALSPATSNPTTPAIAKSVDGVVLCVLLGKMLSSEAKQTVGLIGQNKFVGSVILRPTEVSNGK